jgi:phosphoserine phosphatase
LTEAAETTSEDIEFLRAKLRELKTEARDYLTELRNNRDKMREYKRIRDDYNKEVKNLIESVKAERQERDRINDEIQEWKDKRTALHDQLKSLYDEIRELRSNLVGSPSNDQRKMMRRVEELEWKQQTEQLTIEEERALVEEVVEIEKKLVKIGQEKEKQDRIHELRRLARKLKGEASDAHQKVLDLSEKSQVHHREVVRIRPQLEEYKKAADTAHQNFVEWLKKVKAGEEQLKEVRQQIDEIQSKIRKQSTDSREARRHERRKKQRETRREKEDEAVDKLKAGKRLTFDEFILARRGLSDELNKDEDEDTEEESSD